MKGILKQGQQVLVNYATDGLFVTDKKMVRNILINLLGNAVKFSGENAIIRVDANVADKTLCLLVKDEGIGISEEDQQHMFTSFYRGRNAVNIPGTGLGLHIVKKYLDLISGNIRIDSKLGKGTTVSIELPDLSIPAFKNSI